MSVHVATINESGTVVAIEVRRQDDELVAGEVLANGFAFVGGSYDADRDAFIPPTPFPSWVLDEATCLWVAPIAYPAEGMHTWDEQAGDWVEVTDENS